MVPAPSRVTEGRAGRPNTSWRGKREPGEHFKEDDARGSSCRRGSRAMAGGTVVPAGFLRYMRGRSEALFLADEA